MPLDARELSRKLKKLDQSLKTFPRDATVDEVHELRTRSFRVENILQALGMDSSGNEKKLLAQLEEIRRRAGKVRDLDIFTSHTVGLGIAAEPECVVRLVHHFGYQRHRQALKLHSAVHDHSAALRQRLKVSRRKLKSHIQRFLKKKTHLGKEKTGRDEAPLHATSVALRLLEELRTVRRLGQDNLHSFRIEVKRLRYVLEMADEEKGKQKDLIDELKLVQDAIGEWHDWMELTAIAHDVLQHEKSCRVVQRLESTSQAKFTEALRIAEQLRRRYLVGDSASKRPKSGEPLPTSVLAAASKILA